MPKIVISTRGNTQKKIIIFFSQNHVVFVQNVRKLYSQIELDNISLLFRVTVAVKEHEQELKKRHLMI